MVDDETDMNWCDVGKNTLPGNERDCFFFLFWQIGEQIWEVLNYPVVRRERFGAFGVFIFPICYIPYLKGSLYIYIYDIICIYYIHIISYIYIYYIYIYYIYSKFPNHLFCQLPMHPKVSRKFRLARPPTDQKRPHGYSKARLAESLWLHKPSWDDNLF